MNIDKKLVIKKNITTSYGKRGYSILKSKIDNKQLQEIKKDLTFKPFICQDYGISTLPFPIYQESLKKIYLPKHYGFEKFGDPQEVKISEGYDIDLKFVGNLRNKQEIVIKKFLESCQKGSLTSKTFGGIISVPCGWGKTIMALYLLVILKKKTLIVVHKEFLMNQWIERINQFIPGATIGKLQASIIDIEEKDIVIAMLQSLSMKEYNDDIFNSFGFVIIDECHHIGAEVFSKALPKINCRYSLGLSATPNRNDGLTKVFTLYLGPILFKASGDKDKPVLVNIIYYKDNNPSYCKEELTNLGKICVPRMINNISTNVNRNKLIIYLAKYLVTLNKQVIILSDRRDQLSYLYGILNKITSVGYYIGGMKQKDLDISEKAKVILGTFPMSSEGLDIPSLEAAIFATPKSSIEQSIGRITRKKHDTIPIAFDIVDCFSIFNNQIKKREKIYKKLNYIIKQGDLIVNNDNLNESKLEYFLENDLKTIDDKKKKCLIEDY